MCGIAGVALKNGEVGPIIYECLKRLEYRGYDSVGEAAVIDGRIVVKKDKGKIDEVERELAISNLPATVGIGHTRWATHGAPSAENAHPHTDCVNSVAVVHNGIIENFMELRQELEHEGHTFKSRTDTEVVAHLVESHLRSGDDFGDAVRKTARRLKGAYALAMISTSNPKEIVCVRKESPLVLGTSKEGNYCASDIPAFLPRSNQVILLEDDEMGIITSENITILRISDGSTVHREAFTVDWSIERAAKDWLPPLYAKRDSRTANQRQKCSQDSSYLLGSHGFNNLQSEANISDRLRHLLPCMLSGFVYVCQPCKSLCYHCRCFRIHRQLWCLNRRGYGRACRVTIWRNGRYSQCSAKRER